MKKIIYLTILLGCLAGCRKETKVIYLPAKAKELIGKDLPLWYAEGTNIGSFGLAYTQYGQTKWKISFREGFAGLYYLPDRSILDENGDSLPGDQYIPAQIIERTDSLTLNFPIPNQDIRITKTRKIPTAWLSGSYTITSSEDIDAQKGWVLTKIDGSNKILLLDR